MLLIDGVKYQLWAPTSEDEFERVVKEHSQDIFGEQSLYFDMQHMLKSVLGVGSIPDAFVIVLGSSPHWHIVEIELSSHPIHEHVISQVSKFMDGIENSDTKYGIIDAIWNEINENELLKYKLRKTIGPVDSHKFLSDIISKLPELTVIIEKEPLGLKNALSKFGYLQSKVVEFQTFTREEVGLTVHAHLFEPLYKVPPPPEPPSSPEGESFELSLAPSCMKYYYIHIPKAKKELFPNSKTSIELDTDIGLITVVFNIDPAWGAWLQKGLSDWFKAHKELKARDKVKFTVIEPLKKYRLDIAR